MFQPHLILHPTDFSDCSGHAFRVARDLAEKYQAKLLVVHVAETLGPGNVTFGEVATQPQPEGYRQRLWNDFRELAPRPDAAIAIEHVLAEGDPAREIERLAKERRCDLIVLGTHGRTGLARLIIGSVAEHIVRHAFCPVLTVKGP